MLWKCYTQYASKSGKFSSGHRTEKGQFSLKSQRKAMPKNVQTTAQLHSSHMQVMLKIFQTRFQQYVSYQMFKLDLEKSEEPEIKLPTSAGSSKKQESSRRTFALLTTSRSLTVWITKKLWKILKEIGIPDTLPASWEICRQVKKQRLELDMEKQTGSKSGKEYDKAIYCQPVYLTYMESTSCKMPG